MARASNHGSVGDDRADSVDLVLALILFAALGLTLVFGASELVQRARSGAPLLRYEIPRSGDTLASVAVVDGLVCIAVLALARTRRLSAARLLEIALRISPAIPLAALPLLLRWQRWVGLPIEFLATVLLVGWAIHRTVLIALAEPPLIQKRGSSAFSRLLASKGLRSSRTSQMAPLLLVVAGAAAYAIYFSYVTIQAHHNGHTRSYDLGIFDNLMWNLVNGDLSLRSSPATGPTGSHFGRHATLLAYGFAPIYAVRARPETLLILQATLLGAAAVPLHLLARLWLAPWPAALLALLYLLYPPLHGATLFDFHFVTLAPVFVFFLAYAIASDRRRLVIAMTVLTLALREDAALFVALLGLWQVVARERVRLGYTLLAIGLGYFAIVKFALMPLSASADSYAFLYEGLIPPGEGGPRAAMRRLIANPGFVLVTLVTAGKLHYVLQLFAPLCFLPLRRPLGLLFTIPGILLTLLVPAYAPVIRISFQYTVFWTPALFVAAVLHLRPETFRQTGPGEILRRRRAWLAAITVTGLLCSYQFGAVLQRNTAAGGFLDPYPFTTSDADRERRQAREEILRLVPRDAKVAAAETLVPHLSGRPDAYTLRDGVRDAEYVVVSLRPDAAGEHEVVRQALAAGVFGVEVKNEEFALLRRGASSSGNALLLRQLSARRGE